MLASQQQMAQEVGEMSPTALHDLELEGSSQSTAWPSLKIPDNALLSTFFANDNEEHPGTLVQ